MPKNYTILHMELDSIRDFFRHVDNEAGREIWSAFERNDRGEFDDPDDFDNALYDPANRQEMAARAVCYELNALIERELQRAAHRPWLTSSEYPGPKTLLDLQGAPSTHIRSLKMVEDLPFRKIVDLIQEAYSVKIEDLEGGRAFLEMRKRVNSFKHRDGWVDFRKETSKGSHFMKRYEADAEGAYKAIDDAGAFVKKLWAAVDRAPTTPKA